MALFDANQGRAFRFNSKILDTIFLWVSFVIKHFIELTTLWQALF